MIRENEMEREEEGASSYHDERAEQIRKNNEVLRTYGIPTLVKDLNTIAREGTKRKKRRLEETIPATNGVLRSQSARISQSDAPSQFDRPCMSDNGVEIGNEDGAGGEDNQQQKKRDVWKRTRMHSVYDRKGQPPVPVEYNAKGQPVCENALEFSNFLCTVVKRDIPVKYKDWREVNVTMKTGLMTTLRKYYVVDDKLKDWVMGSAHKKWRDFKSNLKEKFFEDSKTDEEMKALRDDRISPEDWEELIKFWRSEEAKKRSQQGIENRSKQCVMHKAGSKSYARVSEEMFKENGYYPRRDELFVRTHSKKDGTPINDAAAKVIGDIEMAIDTNPELLEKTIEQGDILSHVLGREKNGYVRCIGIGPSPADLRIPGGQKLKSTKLQLAEEETKQAWRANEALKEQVDDIQHGIQLRIDALTEELSQLKNLIVGNLTS
ncbi:uncharacterized protein LOC100826644 [Brachypodium distachyon]|uniref:uncharacterized protein LOC100826644 n=1 Tax=Brachypodium distachyon TaxID=15368 RepID=UPI00052FE33B|nr:uncharacterized protein LOC100826644 [Brachypodium distachyon]|eukprot:XP_010233183.1 uncharacterized protein LOC100826644 [Brachypodium distachyon]